MKHMHHVVEHAKHLRHRAHAKARAYFPYGIILVDVLLAILVVVQFFSVYQFTVFPITNEVKWIWSTATPDYLALAAAVLLLLMYHSIVIRRYPLVRSFFSNLNSALWAEFSEKKREVRGDLRLLALLLFDAFVIGSVALMLYAFLDPVIVLFPWERFGVFPPATTLVNAGVFALILAFYYHLYRITKPFRELHRARKLERAFKF